MAGNYPATTGNCAKNRVGQRRRARIARLATLLRLARSDSLLCLAHPYSPLPSPARAELAQTDGVRNFGSQIGPGVPLLLRMRLPSIRRPLYVYCSAHSHYECTQQTVEGYQSTRAPLSSLGTSGATRIPDLGALAAAAQRRLIQRAKGETEVHIEDVMNAARVTDVSPPTVSRHVMKHLGVNWR